MATPQIPLSAEKRVPFDETIPRMGVDLTGATLLCHIRARRGDTGTPVIALANAGPPSQGLSIAYDADFVDPQGKLPNGASLLRIMISEATLEALPLAADPTKPAEYQYDIHVTPLIGTKFVYASGSFTVDPGVTL